MKWMAWRSRAADQLAVDPTMRALQSAASEAQKSRLPQMAAALSYRTLFGLLPVVVVGLIVVRTFTSPQTQADVIRGAMERFGVSNIVVSAPVETGSAVGGSAAPAGGATSALSPEMMGPPVETLSGTQSLGEWVTAVIYRADANINFGAIGLIGVATLIYAAISMLVEIERAFNQIYRVPVGRSWMRRITNYWTLLTLGVGALVATFYIGARFEAWVAQAIESRGLSLGSGALTLTLVGYGVTVAISTLLLMLAYTVVPNTRVKALPALCGAAVGAILWEAGKWGFGQYLAYSTSYAKLYGSIALVPLFMLWVYVTWFIVLFGLQITYQMQHGLKRTQARPISDAGPAMADPAAALSVMGAVTRGFNAGKRLTAGEIAQAAKLNEAIVGLVLEPLLERGLVVRVEHDGLGGGGSEEEPVYTLGRPAAGIRAADVLAAGFAVSGAAEVADMTVVSMRRAQLDAVGERSLAEVVGAAGPTGARGGGAIIGDVPVEPAREGVEPPARVYAPAAIGGGGGVKGAGGVGGVGGAGAR